MTRSLLTVLLLVGLGFANCPPATVTCPEDNAVMYATGQMKYVNGAREYEFVHETVVPSDPQPYDPRNQQPYKAPKTIKHTTWVVCEEPKK
jgi:hypothetical protein